MLSESEIVAVSVSVAQAAVTKAGFGLLAIFESSTTLPSGARYGLYSSITDVGAVYATTTEAYKAAAKFFSAKPQPTQLMIARMFTAAVPGELMGAPLTTTTLATLTAINNGAISVVIDGVARNVTAINLTGAASLSAAAALIQTAVAAVNPSATCVYTLGRFILRSGTTGATSTVAFATAAGSGTDLSPLINLTQALGATSTVGSALESVTQSLTNVAAQNNTFYMAMLAIAGVTTQNNVDGAAWALSNTKVWGSTYSTGDALSGGATTDLGYLLNASSNGRAFTMFDLTGLEPYAVAAAFGQAATVDFTGTDSTETLMFKVLPGVTLSQLSTTMQAVLDVKKYNYYISMGGNPMLMRGTMADGTWFDQVQGLDWLSAGSQDVVFQRFYGSRKVPQTDRGMAAILHDLTVFFNGAVKNGLLAPGVWNGPPIGQKNTGDYLDKGFYLWADSVDNQTQSARNTRIGPPVTILAKGAGALQGINILINFQQ